MRTPVADARIGSLFSGDFFQIVSSRARAHQRVYLRLRGGTMSINVFAWKLLFPATLGAGQHPLPVPPLCPLALKCGEARLGELILPFVIGS